MQQDIDNTVQPTTWLVGPDLRRTWVPDGGTYIWLKNAGALGPTRLSAAWLDALPDRTGVHATTDHLGVNFSPAPNTWIHSLWGGYVAVFQYDGNLVVYNSKGPLWASGTAGRATGLVNQDNGNLVLYNSAMQVVWQTGTAGQGLSMLRMQGDGNLVLIRADGRPTWATHTTNGTNQLHRPQGYRL